MRLTDLAEVSKIGKERGIATMTDNTFMSPFFQRPLKYGVDVVVYSATKYLGGHSDVLGGIDVSSDAFIQEKRVYVEKSWSLSRPV